MHNDMIMRSVKCSKYKKRKAVAAKQIITPFLKMKIKSSLRAVGTVGSFLAEHG